MKIAKPSSVIIDICDINMYLFYSTLLTYLITRKKLDFSHESKSHFVKKENK